MWFKYEYLSVIFSLYFFVGIYNSAAEQKAHLTYNNILRVVRDNPNVCEPIKFLHAREIVYFQRFGEALRIVQDRLNEKNFYAFNPGFDCSE